MQLIRHGYDHDVTPAHPGNHFAEQVGVFLRRIGFQRRIAERLAGKSRLQARILGQRPQGTAVEGADLDFAHQAEPLQLIERQQICTCVIIPPPTMHTFGLATAGFPHFEQTGFRLINVHDSGLSAFRRAFNSIFYALASYGKLVPDGNCPTRSSSGRRRLDRMP